MTIVDLAAWGAALVALIGILAVAVRAGVIKETVATLKRDAATKQDLEVFSSVVAATTARAVSEVLNLVPDRRLCDQKHREVDRRLERFEASVGGAD